MQNKYKIAVIIPALNEEKALPYVLKDIPQYVDNIIVVDNGSTDKTYEIAQQSGVCVVSEPYKGYGAACLTGMKQLNKEDIVVFLDADYSDDPKKMDILLNPIIKSNYDMVISNRFNTALQKKAMGLVQYFGNKLAVFLIKLFWHYPYKDLGPFRAIKTKSLIKLNMIDKNYGWTIEMQIKAIQYRLKIAQRNIPYRARIGKSKISGTLKGILFAGSKIIYKIFYYKILEVFHK